jgi:hypothetical protein
VKSAAQDISENLDARLAEFQSLGEDFESEHEFIANFNGSDGVLQPAYDRLTAKGFHGGAPAGGGWIYMHVRRPLTRASILHLTHELDEVARASGCLFELLDVTLASSAAPGRIVILGKCDRETFLNA